MRSYGAARFVYNLCGFLSWAVIIVGAILANGGFATLGIMSRDFGASPLTGIVGSIPGLSVMFLGFIGLVLTQNGRVAVDTAEYTQQGLKLAREQIEISRQALKQGATLNEGYAQLQAAKTELRGLIDGSSPGPSIADAAMPEPAQTGLSPGDIVEHRGRTIRALDTGFHLDGTVYPSLEEAKSKIDGTQRSKEPQIDQAKPVSKVGGQVPVSTVTRSEPQIGARPQQCDDTPFPPFKLRLPSDR